MVTDLTVTAEKAATLNRTPGSKIISSQNDTNKPVSFLMESEVYQLDDAACYMRNVTGLDYKRVYPHLMRHTGSLARLKRTGNIRSVQEHLGHGDSKVTQRYLKTMQAIESLEIESKVQFDR